MADTDLTPSDAAFAVAEPRRLSPPQAPDYLEGEFREVPPRRLRDHLRVLSKHRRLAAGCFVACIIAAGVITVLTPRTYTAATRIQVARSSPIKLQLKDNVLDLEETERILNGASSFISTQVQALKSRDVAERAIRNFHLADNPAFNELAQGGTALAAVGVSLPSFLQPRGLPEPAAVDPAAAADAGPVDPVLLDRYSGYLAVEDMRGTDLIEVRFAAPNPSLAALLASAHIQAYLASIKDAQVATDSTAMAFLADQLADARTRVDHGEAALASFAAAHPEVAVNQEDQLIGKQITELSAQLSDAEGRRTTAQSRFEFLAKAKHEPLEHFLDESGAIAKLRLSLLDIRTQEAALKQRLGPNHSEMRELRQRETEVRLQLDNEVQQEIAAARARFKEAKLHEDELRSRLVAREKFATELRALGAQYEMLKGELETSRELYASLLKQKTDTAVHAELAASTVRVIERPEVPRYATSPRLRLNLLLGALAGTVLAVGAAFFRESLDNSVKSSEEAEGLLQLPTLAIIPNFALVRSLGRPRLLTSLRPTDLWRANGAGADTAHPLVVARDPWSPVAEAFRILRTSLLFSSGAPPQVILVTSAAAGEGKTVTALNLASTLAESGRRVLVVDVDLRHPGCHDVLDVALQPGLSAYLAGEAELAPLIRELASPRLSFLSAGARPLNPAELVGSERLRAALAVLRTQYDFIVLDAPPVLPVTDAVLLAREADGVVLVMKGRTAPGDLVRRARDQLLFAGARLMGVVVNNVDRSWGTHHLYDSYPHYQAARAVSGADVDAREV
jgi:polysaccharide biosynthesis transport protein